MMRGCAPRLGQRLHISVVSSSLVDRNVPHPEFLCVCLCLVVSRWLSLDFAGPSYLVSLYPDVLVSSVRAVSIAHIIAGFQILIYAYLSVMAYRRAMLCTIV